MKATNTEDGIRWAFTTAAPMRYAGSITEDEVLGGPLGTVLVGCPGDGGGWMVMGWVSGVVERLLKHFHRGRQVK
jgi:hypothetical protein